MNKSNCETCKYKKINKDKSLHCYMFKDEPKDKCMQWKGVNVGTIGHHAHGKSLLLNAMLTLAIQSKNINKK